MEHPLLTKSSESKLIYFKDTKATYDIILSSIAALSVIMSNQALSDKPRETRVTVCLATDIDGSCVDVAHQDWFISNIDDLEKDLKHGLRLLHYMTEKLKALGKSEDLEDFISEPDNTEEFEIHTIKFLVNIKAK